MRMPLYFLRREKTERETHITFFKGIPPQTHTYKTPLIMDVEPPDLHKALGYK